jgi:hypothetical protein
VAQAAAELCNRNIIFLEAVPTARVRDKSLGFRSQEPLLQGQAQAHTHECGEQQHTHEWLSHVRTTSRHKFSKVPDIVIIHSKGLRVLSFENGGTSRVVEAMLSLQPKP